MAGSMTDDEIDAALFRARVPAIAMLRTRHATDAGTPGCWFGGAPGLPPWIPWPVFSHPEIGIEIPMHHLVQINLAYCPRVLGLPPMPRTGTLFVFLDPVCGPCDILGEEPFKSGRGQRVIHVPEDVSGHPPRSGPPMPDLSAISRWYRNRGYWGTSAFTRWPFGFLVIDAYHINLLPCGGDPRVAAASAAVDEAIAEHLGLSGREELRRVHRRQHTLCGATVMEALPGSADLAADGERIGAVVHPIR